VVALLTDEHIKITLLFSIHSLFLSYLSWTFIDSGNPISSVASFIVSKTTKSAKSLRSQAGMWSSDSKSESFAPDSDIARQVAERALSKKRPGDANQQEGDSKKNQQAGHGEVCGLCLNT
jgi:hypothetical protein